MYDVEIPIETVVILNSQRCEIVESGKTCKNCYIRTMTAIRKSAEGHSRQCGGKNGNLSGFLCHADLRSDNKNIIFKLIK